MCHIKIPAETRATGSPRSTLEVLSLGVPEAVARRRYGSSDRSSSISSLFSIGLSMINRKGEDKDLKDDLWHPATPFENKLISRQAQAIHKQISPST